jgi:aminopeptidase N
MHSADNLAVRTVHKITDYKKPNFNITAAHLEFQLDESSTMVKSKLSIVRNSYAASTAPLVLSGENLTLIDISLNGDALAGSAYTVTSHELTINEAPDSFTLEITVSINPKANTSLNGLYVSGGNFATQCEPHGFRCITYYLDRPDVLSKFTTKIIANKAKYPQLLSNGNLVATGDAGNGDHFVCWKDPSLKPSYLFALVAGNLDVAQDKFTTMNGNNVKLQVYVEIGKKNQADFAITALKKAMVWDEKVYGRVYDLNIYMIVAVSDFNFGAMENKGLNIFNDQYVLTHQDLATDADYEGVLGVIGHEYFHNWSGNRVTCRDWFQLSLKEGLTVFRDQSFSADMTSKIAVRIASVDTIRNVQFAEDAGPMSHAVKPQSYVSMNNFYTTTVYNKGAELIRMLHTIVGEELFFQGMNIYFAKNDGSAVTTDEFIAAHEEASGLDLTQFKLWYLQAGTPQVVVRSDYNLERKELSVTLAQSCSKNANYLPMHIPISFGLLNSKGEELAVKYNNFNAANNANVIHLTESSQTITLKNIEQKPVLSLLRDFSAPVKLIYEYTLENLITIMLFDSDSFNRYDAASQIMQTILISSYEAKMAGAAYKVPAAFLVAFESCIKDQKLDSGLKSHLLTMPNLKAIIMQIAEVKIDVLAMIYSDLKKYLGKTFNPAWQELYDLNNTADAYEFNSKAVMARKLKNIALSYLAADPDCESTVIIASQFEYADNMTDKTAALAAINDHDSELRDQLFTKFYDEYQSHPLVIDKWFRLQALSTLPGTLRIVTDLMSHAAYDMHNPNRVRSLLGAFAGGNYTCFHDDKGLGYAMLVDNIIKIDHYNPQLAARLLEPLSHWRFYDKARQNLIRNSLLRVTNTDSLSDDLYEVASKAASA